MLNTKMVKRAHLCIIVRVLFISFQIRIITHLIVALLLGALYHGVGADAGRIISNTSCLFFFLLFLFFSNAMPTIHTCKYNGINHSLLKSFKIILPEQSGFGVALIRYSWRHARFLYTSFINYILLYMFYLLTSFCLIHSKQLLIFRSAKIRTIFRVKLLILPW